MLACARVRIVRAVMMSQPSRLIQLSDIDGQLSEIDGRSDVGGLQGEGSWTGPAKHTAPRKPACGPGAPYPNSGAVRPAQICTASMSPRAGRRGFTRRG